MHILATLAVLGAVAALIVWSISSRRGAGGPAHPVPGVAPNKSWDHPLAFIASGKVFCRMPGAPVREIQSPYIQGVMDRAEKARQLHGWKEGTSLGQSFTGMGRSAPAGTDIRATSAQFTASDRIIYFLRDDNVGGLFEYDLTAGTEKRLVHRQHLLLEDIRLGSDGGRLLAAQHVRNGTASIVVMNLDGKDYRELTGGDTVDTAPAWIPDRPGAILFQSSGLARNPQGQPVALGPASIQMMDLATRALTPVLEDARWDYLQPRVAPNGYLFFIRRPYEAPAYGTKNALLDALLFPFRLLRALFAYLNFFSLMYTRKPLTSAGGPKVQSDLKEILLRGRRVDAEQALRSGALVSGVPSLVPASWQLVCRSRQGQEWVLASHVASYDLAPDGAVLFTNGYGAFGLDGSVPPQVLLRDQLIGDVVVGSASVAAAPPPAAEASRPNEWSA